MADAFVGAIAQVLLEKLLSLATENIGLVVGFKKDVETLRVSIEMIQVFLANGEERKLKKRDAVNRWLKNLEGVAYEADNVFDELNYERLRRKVQIQNQQPMREKVCFFFSFCRTNIAFRWGIARKIRDIHLKVKKMNDEANSLGLQSQLVASAANTVDRTGPIASRETDSLVGRNVVGRANDASNIVELLLSPSAEVVSFLPIIGMGGLGKTTLAKMVYNDEQIKNHFKPRIWVCVSDKSFDDTRLFKLILESLTESKVDLTARDAIVRKIKDELMGKRYFLVLDDVWEDNPQVWSKFLDSLNGISTNQGNWSIVTTRKVRMSSILPACRPLNLQNLADDDCWSIVEKNAFSSGGGVPTEMEEIRKKVTTLCQGLPLAATVIGGLLRGKAKDEWLSIIDKGISNMRGDDNYVMEILKLSVDHLPSGSIKKCFAYCSLFSKDTDIDKEELIQLWMAEGFLQPNLDSGKMMEQIGGKMMEEIGDDYLNTLLQSSLLQEVRDEDEDDSRRFRSRVSIRMHDLVHDLAQSVSKSEVINLRDGVRDGDCHARYIVADQLDDGTDTILKEASSSIRTLFAEDGTFDGKLLQLKYLRTLTLSRTETEELPSSINKLIHLRFLNVYGSRIRALPESLCKLYHLQTLRIEECRLEEFPKSMSNLISLRHLYFYSSDSAFRMPKGVGKLTCLQKLQFFNVSREEGRQINELGSLKNLRGKIKIRNLELVNGEKDAKGANLAGKTNLLALKLEWSEDRQANNHDEDVLKGLQPHLNLQELRVKNFMGSHFPSWLMNMAEGPRYGLSPGTVIRLVRLELKNCKECTEIPVLGHLPFLKCLELRGLEKLTGIGPSFCGTSGTGIDDFNASGFIKTFPALKTLLFEDMPNLIEWRGLQETTLPTPTEQAGVFPKLERLTIRRCPKLTSAPSHFPSLRHLIIEGTDELLPEINICSKVTTLESLQLKSLGGFKCFGDVVFSNNPNLLSLELSECPDLTHVRGWFTSLRELDIKNCDHLSELPEDLFKFCSLEELSIWSCPKLKSIQIPIPSINNSNRQQHQHRLRQVAILYCEGLISVSGGECELAESSSCNANSNTSSLEHLDLYGCPNLEYFGVDVEHAPSLSHLGLCFCPNLKAMPKLSSSLRELGIGPFSEEFDDWSPLSSLSSLSLLCLYGRSHWESLPRELQHLTSLTELTLNDCGIEALPDWFGDFVSLERLSLWGCEKLRYLPSAAAMSRLTKLRDLRIDDCPLLKERCSRASSSSRPDDSEWSKISHIPNIYIDY